MLFAVQRETYGVSPVATGHGSYLNQCELRALKVLFSW